MDFIKWKDKIAAQENSIVILYGAGRQAAEELAYLRENKIEPIGFCDMDKMKQGNEYLGLTVYGIEEVKNKYPNCYFYITIAQPLRDEVAEILIEQYLFSKTNIINYNYIKKYKSCGSLENCIIFMTDKLYSCCELGDIRNYPPEIYYDDNIVTSIKKFIKMRDKIIEDNQDPNKKTPCSGCPDLQEGFWDTDRKIKIMAISPDFPCQARCSYCHIEERKNEIPKDKLNKLLEGFSIKEIFEYFKKEDLLELQEPIQFSAGEITINPRRDEILDTLMDYPVQMFSNAIIYNEKVSKLISGNGSFLNLSLDCGTPETFQIIKGISAFEQVVENIERYCKEGGAIHLKYIILSENCNEQDEDGCISICVLNHIKTINIACDIYMNHAYLPNEIIQSAIRLVKKARRHGIVANILPYFGDENMKTIEKALCNSNETM